MKLLTEIWQRRSAVKHLMLKNFRVRYRNMALGVVWSVINPLIMLGVLAFVFTFVYPHPDRSENFPLFLLIGLVHFNIFSRMLPAATVSMIEHASLIKKLSFPRLIIPIAVIASQLVDVVILVVLLLVFALLFGLPITFSFLWFLLGMVILMIFILGIGFICAALNVYYRDTLYIVESALTILFWLTPIFYPLDFIRLRLPPLFTNLFILNPMAGCIEGARRAILYQSCPDLRAYCAAIAVSLVTFVVGIIVFQRMQRRFADFL